MGWLIGGIVVLFLVARSNAAASICIAPTTGGTASVTPTQSTIGPVHVSPSQSLVCHATAVGCPTLPLPSTASDGAVGGGQPVSPLLPVQLANCNHIVVGSGNFPVGPTTSPVNRPVKDPVSAPIAPVAPIFHCDHIVCSVGPIAIFNPISPILSRPVTLAPVQPQPLIKPPLGNQGGGSFGGILEGEVCLGDASKEF